MVSDSECVTSPLKVVSLPNDASGCSSVAIPPPLPTSFSHGEANDDEYQELALDDDVRFSTVSLQTPTTSRPAHLSDPIGDTGPSGSSKRLTNSSVVGQKSPRSSLPDDDPLQMNFPDKGTEENEADRSSVPFLIARLEQQKERIETDPRAQRASIDGHLRLKEDFQKLQEREQQQLRDDPEAEIDWGLSHT